MTELFGIGFFAGLALAIPVGPMALLLIQTTIQQGIRCGVAGGLGMATVDFIYAVAVVTVGSAIATFLGTWGSLVSWLGASILAILGFLTIRNNWSSKTPDWSSSEPNRASPVITFVKFVGATFINPPTALYFLAMSATLRIESGSVDSDLGTVTLSALTFGLGVFIGSGIWQQALAFGASSLRTRLTAPLRKWIGVISGLLIIALATRTVIAP